METPRLFRSRMTLNSTSTSVALSAEVGSSMIRIRELTESARAISTICCWPRRSSSTGVRDRCPPRVQPSAGVSGVPPPQSPRPTRHDFATHEDVVANVHVRRQAQLLMDDGNTAIARLGGYAKTTGSPSRIISPDVGRTTPERFSSMWTCPPRFRRTGSLPGHDGCRN